MFPPNSLPFKIFLSFRDLLRSHLLHEVFLPHIPAGNGLFLPGPGKALSAFHFALEFFVCLFLFFPLCLTSSTTRKFPWGQGLCLFYTFLHPSLNLRQCWCILSVSPNTQLDKQWDWRKRGQCLHISGLWEVSMSNFYSLYWKYQMLFCYVTHGKCHLVQIGDQFTMKNIQNRCDMPLWCWEFIGILFLDDFYFFPL